MSNQKEQTKSFDTEGIFEGDDEPIAQPTQYFEKPRIQKLMLLGGMMINDKKTKEIKGVNLIFIDAIERDTATGQPVMRGFSPILTMYVSEDKQPDVLSAAVQLLHETVFSTVYAKISGNENFYRLHGFLTPEQVDAYRTLMEGLV